MGEKTKAWTKETWARLKEQVKDVFDWGHQYPRKSQGAKRFGIAIEQLGQPGEDKLAVRLGGIYALEQIAKAFPRDYHWKVMEALTAYVRENSPWPPKTGQPTQADTLPLSGHSDGRQHDERAQSLSKSAPDIQAILTVLRRREGGDKKEGQPLNLMSTDLRRTFLYGAHLEGALLWGAHLEGANLTGAHLEGANLNRAHLEGALLTGAHLEGARLYEAHLEGANLTGAHLKKARLDWADLTGVVGLTKEQMESAIIHRREGTKLPDYLRVISSRRRSPWRVPGKRRRRS